MKGSCAEPGLTEFESGDPEPATLAIFSATFLNNHWISVEKCHVIFLVGGNSFFFFMFTPKLGEDVHFDEHIFQMGGSTTN